MMQDYFITPIRAAAILTGSYVAGTVIGPTTPGAPANKNQMNLLVDFTLGSLTSASIKVEFSHDGTTYFQDTFMNISGATADLSPGVYRVAADGKYIINVPIKYNYVKVSAIGTGTATDSSMTIDAIIGVV